MILLRNDSKVYVVRVISFSNGTTGQPRLRWSHFSLVFNVDKMIRPFFCEAKWSKRPHPLPQCLDSLGKDLGTSRRPYLCPARVTQQGQPYTVIIQGRYSD